MLVELPEITRIVELVGTTVLDVAWPPTSTTDVLVELPEMTRIVELVGAAVL